MGNYMPSLHWKLHDFINHGSNFYPKCQTVTLSSVKSITFNEVFILSNEVTSMEKRTV